MIDVALRPLHQHHLPATEVIAMTPFFTRTKRMRLVHDSRIVNFQQSFALAKRPLRKDAESIDRRRADRDGCNHNRTIGQQSPRVKPAKTENLVWFNPNPGLTHLKGSDADQVLTTGEQTTSFGTPMRHSREWPTQHSRLLGPHPVRQTSQVALSKSKWLLRYPHRAPESPKASRRGKLDVVQI